MTDQNESAGQPAAEAPKSARAKPQTEQATRMRPPSEWLDETFPVDAAGRRPRESWKHASAAVLHGWGEHAHHAGKEIDLSREDYLAALKAVAPDEFEADGKTVAKHSGVYAPHPKALSEHCAHARKGS